MIPEWGTPFGWGQQCTARGCCSVGIGHAKLDPGHLGAGQGGQAAMAGVGADVEALGMGTMVGLWLPVE
jgi:hypothetical protein